MHPAVQAISAAYSVKRRPRRITARRAGDTWVVRLLEGYTVTYRMSMINLYDLATNPAGASSRALERAASAVRGYR